MTLPKIYKKLPPLIPVRKAKKVAKIVTDILEIRDIRYEICGGLRRGYFMVTGVSLIVTRPIEWTIDALAALSLQEIRRYDKNVEFGFVLDDVSFVIRSARGSSWGASVLWATGTQPFLKVILAHARAMEYRLTPTGLFLGDDCIAGKTEQQIFDALMLPFVKPEKRARKFLHKIFYDVLVLKPMTRKKRNKMYDDLLHPRRRKKSKKKRR